MGDPGGKEAILTAAIDFGTTYSGYAFSFAGKQDEILTNTNWSSQFGMISYKTPTCVLTRYLKETKQHEFVEFGYKAHDLYVRESKDETLCLFDKFKMSLHKLEEQVS